MLALLAAIMARMTRSTSPPASMCDSISACETARGRVRAGEGVIGLTWALFVAGAPTQIVSQRSVNDESTAVLMQRFYANLTQKKLTKGDSLRQATLSLLRDPKYKHPHYWAPFILMGDWR